MGRGGGVCGGGGGGGGGQRGIFFGYANLSHDRQVIQ